MAQSAAFAADDERAAPIDTAHLARMTFGDRALEREVLLLFDRQAESMVMRMPVAEPEAVYALAHALKGSARGIGAFAVASAAEAVEQAVRGDGARREAATGQLAVAVDAARAAIAGLLHN